jgi:hypothetical protein
MSNKTPTALEAFFMYQPQANGANLPQRPITNYLGGTVTDDPVNNRTNVQLSTTSGTGFTTLSANFNQPAIGASVSAQVATSTPYSVGVEVWIPGGGLYVVSAIPDGTHLTLINSGGPNNVAAGVPVSNGVLILPSGAAPLLIQGNDALMVPQRGILDFRGFTVTDDAANARTVVQPASPITRINHGGSPYSPNLATFLGQLNLWADVTGGVITYNAQTPPDATELAVTNSAGDASSSPITMVGGGSDKFQDPNNPTAAPAASVQLKVKQASLRWKYGATEALWLLQ